VVSPSSHFKILDCRFDYEYQGGHIRNSVNANSPDALLDVLKDLAPGTALIFHCELSQLRGPSMMRWLRNYDRCANVENYPRLNYPNLYILQGGYAEFFSHYRSLCDPDNYVPADTCKQTMRQELKAFNKRLNTRRRTMFT
jgi:M-phase inducer tyrosine phosphatase